MFTEVFEVADYKPDIKFEKQNGGFHMASDFNAKLFKYLSSFVIDEEFWKKTASCISTLVLLYPRFDAYTKNPSEICKMFWFCYMARFIPCICCDLFKSSLYDRCRWHSKKQIHTSKHEILN